MRILTTNPSEQAAADTIAEWIWERTDFSEARCLRIARGIIALGDKKDDAEDEA